jgi:hypothetical protein
MESGWCLLQHAATGGSASNFVLLCSAGAKVLEPEESCDLMATAARRGVFTIVERLLSAGLSLQTHEQSSLVLKAAVETGQESKVQFFLGHGVHPDARTASVDTALERAAKDGRVGIVRLLLSRGANISREVVENGTTLTTAVCSGRNEVVGLLITSGADVNAPAYSYWSLSKQLRNSVTLILSKHPLPMVQMSMPMKGTTGPLSKLLRNSVTLILSKHSLPTVQMSMQEEENTEVHWRRLKSEVMQRL